MPIIVQSRRGFKSYKKYDIEQPNDLKKLRRRISDIASEANRLTNSGKIASKKACLTFIAITLHQQGQPNNENVKKVWKSLLKHIAKPEIEVLEQDPETLFASSRTQSRRVSRKVTSYGRNITYALSVSLSLNTVQPLAVIINSHADAIKEHAARRVELFFLLCVALYKTNRDIALSPTTKQHGQATPGVKFDIKYAACHSALFNSVHDTESINGSLNEISILQGTHFAEVLNATVELPVAVNHLDSMCEGKNGDDANGLRQQLLPTLQAVAKGQQSPIDAMTYFFSAMRAFFAGPALEHAQRDTTQVLPEVKEKIRLLEEQGTFYWTETTRMRPSIAAISAWLAISSSKVALFIANNPLGNLEDCYARRQHEIIQNTL
jgi:hypothetical protein